MDERMNVDLLDNAGVAGSDQRGCTRACCRVRISEFGKSGVIGMKQGKDSRFVSSNSGIHSK
jgi:hypothetical protein